MVALAFCGDLLALHVRGLLLLVILRLVSVHVSVPQHALHQQALLLINLLLRNATGHLLLLY